MDAFSMLAAPLATPAATGQHDPTKLIGFFAQEMQLFFQHIQSAVVHYSSSGELPPSLFRKQAVKSLEKAAEAGGKRKEKTKRKPTVFNLFVKEKLEELKAKQGEGEADQGQGANNSLFKQAAQEWSKLSEEEKAAYQVKFAPIIAAMDGKDGEHEEEEHEEHEEQLANGGAAEAPAASPSPKKKKAKHTPKHE